MHTRINFSLSLNSVLLTLFFLLGPLAEATTDTDAEIKTALISPSMGTGLNGIADWSSQLPFIDLMKQSRKWIDWQDKSSTLTIHKNKRGWITKLEPKQTLGTVFLTSKKGLLTTTILGTSKNSNFCVRARKHRPESRSLRGVNEDSRTELTPLSRKKCIFRDALLLCMKATAT